MAVKQYKAGEVIFKQGDFELSMYHIVSGSVGIYLNYGEEAEKQLVALNDGQYFGEMGLIQSMKRSADAVAISDVEIEVLDQMGFIQHVQKNPSATLGLLRQFSDRLRDLTADYQEACRTIADLSTIEKVQEEVKKNEGTPSGSWLSRQMKRFADAYNAGGVDYVHFSL